MGVIHQSSFQYTGYNHDQFVQPLPSQGQGSTPREPPQQQQADLDGLRVIGYSRRPLEHLHGSGSTQTSQGGTTQNNPVTNSTSTQLVAEQEEPLGPGWIKQRRFLPQGALHERAGGKVYLYQRLLVAPGTLSGSPLPREYQSSTTAGRVPYTVDGREGQQEEVGPPMVHSAC